MRKILSVFLSIAMLISLSTFPMTAFAVAAGDSALNDGSTTLGITSSGLTHTFNHAFIGGKSGSDVAGFLNATTSAEGGDRRIYAYNNAANVRSLMSFDVMFTSENAILDIYYTRYSDEACTKNAGAKLVSITPSGGIAKGGYTMITAVPGPTSLSLNEWHNIAVEVPNNGTNSVYIYADGKKYNCYMDGKAYGSYRFYAVVKQGSYYIDNFYKAASEIAVAMYSEADYQISEIEVSANDKITYDADNKTFTCQEGTTVSALKESITTDCDITIFADDTYKTVLDNSDEITANSALVLSKNSKAFRYYNNFEIVDGPNPEDFIGVYNSYDGTAAIKAFDDIEHTYNHSFIGGKTDDVVGYFNAETASTASGRRLPNPWTPSGIEEVLKLRSLMSMDVMFTSENDNFEISYTRYSAETGTATVGSTLLKISPTGGVAKGSYVMNTAVPGPTSLSLNEWHNIAVEVANDGTNSVYVYVDGVKYSCYMDGKGYGTNRFFATVKQGSFYIDNYYCQAGAAGTVLYPLADYQISEIEVSGNDEIAYDEDSKMFTCQEGTTVSALKESITTDCDITIFADDTYKTVLDNSDEITANSALVLSKNSKAFRYYNNFEITKAPGPEDFIGIYNANDGSKELQAMTGFTHTFNHAFIGGKTGNDVAGYLTYKSATERLSNPFAKTFAELSGLRSLIAFDVMFTSETDKLSVSFRPYTKDGTDGQLGAIINITPTEGISKPNTWSMDTLKGPSSFSLNEWHNIAVEIPNQGTNSIKLYVDGEEYICYTKLGNAFGSSRFYATAEKGNFYIDNYYCQMGAASDVMYNKADYVIAEPTVSNDKVSYENGVFTCEEGITAGELKEIITTDCDITVFADDTYKTVLEDNDNITADSALVLSKNSKAFRYYSVELYEAVFEAKITVDVINGIATVKVNGEDKGEAPSVASYPVGTLLTYTAMPDSDNKVFLYWQDLTNNYVVSLNETIEVNAGSDANYVAVYSDVSAGEVYITFKSNNKIIYSSVKSQSKIPTDPYIAGYVFAGWYLNGKKTEVNLDVERNTVYIAGFTADTAEYDVSVSGATTQGGKYKYNDKVTVIAAGQDGKVFSYWTRDNVIVSYNEEYSFYVSGNTEVIANYADTKTEEKIVLVMAEATIVGTDSDKIAFYAERNVPESYRVIETGILLNKTEKFDIKNANIKAKATSDASVGQYTVRKANVLPGETWYAKAYLIYSDGENVLTVYSNVVSKTLN